MSRSMVSRVARGVARFRSDAWSTAAMSAPADDSATSAPTPADLFSSSGGISSEIRISSSYRPTSVSCTLRGTPASIVQTSPRTAEGTPFRMRRWSFFLRLWVVRSQSDIILIHFFSLLLLVEPLPLLPPALRPDFFFCLVPVWPSTTAASDVSDRASVGLSPPLLLEDWFLRELPPFSESTMKPNLSSLRPYVARVLVLVPL
mmetsp:Transcript_20996/g.60190  ORF Transcript_20996/g.60190 Transcript_20996/m.60190 type:complete len:203 (-) Transcript_20996:207-815(-)